MKTYKIIIMAVLTMLSVGCHKDRTARLRIIAETMNGGGKVQVDPSNVNDATWIPGEEIDLNGSAYPVVKDDGLFYLNIGDVELSESNYAIYPANINGADGNIISVTNGNGTGEANVSDIEIARLSVNFQGNGKHKVVFPMAAVATDGGKNLFFRHLTAGLKLSMIAATEVVTVSSISIVVQGDGPAENVEIGGVYYKTHWTVQGPSMPAGEPYSDEDDWDVSYCSEMFLSMKTGNVDGVEIGDSGITFCVPITINSVKRLTVTGYASDGSQLFTRTLTLNPDGDGNYQTLVRNTMYTVPTININ